MFYKINLFLKFTKMRPFFQYKLNHNNGITVHCVQCTLCSTPIVIYHLNTFVRNVYVTMVTIAYINVSTLKAQRNAPTKVILELYKSNINSLFKKDKSILVQTFVYVLFSNLFISGQTIDVSLIKL